MVVVESVSELLVVFVCLCSVEDPWSSEFVELDVESDAPVLPLIAPALGFFCESGFWPVFGFCLPMESGDLVSGLSAEGVCVSWVVVVDDVVDELDVEPLCWSLLPDCATASPAPSRTTEAT